MLLTVHLFTDKKPYCSKLSNTDVSLFNLFQVSTFTQVLNNNCNRLSLITLVNFQNLSVELGFSENNTLSIMDIPATLTTFWSMNFEGKSPTSQAFPVTQCKHDTIFSQDFFMCYNELWQRYIEDNDVHPCNSTDSYLKSKCCHYWTTLLNHRLDPIMKVMRIAMGRGRSHLNISELLDPFYKTGIFKPVEEMMRNKKLSDIQWDKTSYIPFCIFNNKRKQIQEGCKLFEPRITNQGICYSFNAEPIIDNLHESPFTKAFQNVYKSELKQNETINAKGKHVQSCLEGFFSRQSHLCTVLSG